MKLGSLFSGSGGFELAGALNGITPVWASEIEPYVIAVTRSRFPNMKHYGDVCDINGAEIEAVDIITAGSPCQDMSVAGLRAGIYEGKRLEEAKAWCAEHGLVFDAYNANLPERIAQYGGDCRKISADFYADDKNIFIVGVNT